MRNFDSSWPKQYPLVRHGLRALLSSESDLRIVGDTDDLHAAIQLVEELRPDLLILDTALVPAAEQNIVRDLPKKCSCLRIVALTTPDPHRSAFAVQLGTSGVLCKDAPLDLVLMCIRSVIAGQYCIAREDAAALLRGRRAAPRAPALCEANFGLTAREEQVVTAIAGGSTNKEIAQQLSISLATVKHHLTHVFAKTSLPNRLALGTFAIAHHLVP